jgi:surface carbohydrate biosynthesis protein
MKLGKKLANNKLFKFVKLLLKSKVFFKVQNKKNLVIFDDTSLETLKRYLLKDYDYFVIQNRVESINEFYLSPKILFIALKNYILYFSKKIQIQDIYFLSFIEVLNPKVVFTFIDNSIQFSTIAKYTKNKNIKFIALQNGHRQDRDEILFLFNKKLIKKNLNLDFFIPHYLCLGEFEKDNCIKHSINVGKFTFAGYIRLANFLNDLKLDKIKISKNKYDICLLSDYGACYNNYYGVNMNKINQADSGLVKLTKYTIEFCIKKKLKLILLFKRNIRLAAADYKGEQRWYKEKFSEREYDYILKNSQQNDGLFSGYKSSFESKVVVANMSTLLRENLVCGNKILSCNLTKSDLYDFPLKGICSINNCDYEQFENRLLTILEISKSDYFSKIEKNKNYLIHTDNPETCFRIIRNSINEHLQ